MTKHEDKDPERDRKRLPPKFDPYKKKMPVEPDLPETLDAELCRSLRQGLPSKDKEEQRSLPSASEVEEMFASGELRRPTAEDLELLFDETWRRAEAETLETDDDGGDTERDSPTTGS
jgi:hypothetical protein